MRLSLALLSALLLALMMLVAPTAEAGGCPSGYTRSGNKCVKYKYVKRYTCKPGCHYIGNGMCRCRRR